MKRAGERVLQAPDCIDHAADREFHAFRMLQIGQVANPYAHRQTRRGIAPELGLKLSFAVFHTAKIGPRKCCYKRSNLTSGIRKAHRDLSTSALERVAGIRGRRAP